MMYRIPSLIVLVGGTVALTAATAHAHPPVMLRTLPSQPSFVPVSQRVTPFPGGMPGFDRRSWSPYPLNNGMPGSDPRTRSPYPLNNNAMPGSDPRTWSPYPLNPWNNWNNYYNNGPIPNWLQNPNWRSTMPSNVVPYNGYVNPFYVNGYTPFLNPYTMPYGNPYAGTNLPLNGYSLFE
jgi:hypothetical protein